MIERAREEAIANGEIDPEKLEDDSDLPEGDRALLARMSDVGEWVGEVIELDENGDVIRRYAIDENGNPVADP
ncbi:hypothetical protein SAMN04488119_1016 [Oceanicella actignis]|nr:hypothetical protein SAMN04488119_1016 [Oceanicella actignis]